MPIMSDVPYKKIDKRFDTLDSTLKQSGNLSDDILNTLENNLESVLSIAIEHPEEVKMEYILGMVKNTIENNFGEIDGGFMKGICIGSIEKIEENNSEICNAMKKEKLELSSSYGLSG